MNPVSVPTTEPVSLDEILSPYISGLCYGGPGVGKTVFGSGSQYMRTFVFDVDEGMLSVASQKTSEKLVAEGYPPIQKHLIKIWSVNTYDDFKNGLTWLYNHSSQFDLVVVDTITELQRVVMDETLARNKHILADQRDWGLSLNMLEFLGRTFRKMKKHSMLLAHELEVPDNTLNVTKYRANFKGAFGQDYRKHFSLIMRYLMVDTQVQQDNQLVHKTVRSLDCNRDPYQDCKDRSSALSKYEYPIIDNIFYKILTAIQGGTQVQVS